MGPVELLLTQLDEAYNRRAWHGPNLRGSMRGLDAAAAAHRPARNRHNIQEVVVHCAYWKYVVRRRLTGEARAWFPLAGSNWLPRTAVDETTWRADVRLLDDMHRAAAQRRTLPGRVLQVWGVANFFGSESGAQIASRDFGRELLVGILEQRYRWPPTQIESNAKTMVWRASRDRRERGEP